MHRLLLLLGMCAACGGTQSESKLPPQSLQLRNAPQQAAERRQTLERFAGSVFDALVADDANRLVVPLTTLEELVDEAAQDRLSALRVALPSRTRLDEAAFEALTVTSVSGLCVQGAQDEPKGGPHGLRESAWVFQRALVVASRVDNKRTAFWIEGDFVLTDQGVLALDIHSIEAPRWQHSDLEIGQCDVEFGMDR